jgi:hypothetical protein
MTDSNSLIQQIQQLEDDARRYRWIRDNIKERLTDNSLKGGGLEFGFAEHKTQYELPLLISWADFCGHISLDDVIDIKMGCYKEEQEE